jgi:alpha-galactosidase
MMKTTLLLFIMAAFVLSACKTKNAAITKKPMVNFDSLAITPPMGWNSWDCLGLDANESQIIAVADYIAENLKKYGWEYVVIDAGWYHPKELITAAWHMNNPTQYLDKYGRLIPDTLKYPSAKGGIGLRALADYVHSKGLKFGIHVMRGIPWNAVAQNTPIKGTSYFAADVANLQDTCDWSSIMKGVNMDKLGAQEYYNSVYELYAEWGVDFVKVDDMAYPYHTAEIEGVHNAIVNSKAQIVLSLSPGPAPVGQRAHLDKNAHMWRISGDFWDDWKWLKRQFGLCNQWDSIHTPGHWPDADMLPIGKLRKTGGDAWIASQLGSTIEKVTDEYSRFTDVEKYTLFTLYSIFRSPLMLGGYLPENDSVTYKIITNAEVIAVNQNSGNNHEIRNSNGIVIWTADVPGSKAKYIALFNTNDEKPEKISISWKEIGLDGELTVRDLWAKKDIGKFTAEFSTSIEAHRCRLIKVRE